MAGLHGAAQVRKNWRPYHGALRQNPPKSVAACCTTEPYFITGRGALDNAEAWIVASAHAIADGIAQWWKLKSGAMSLYSQYEPPFSFDLAPSDPIDAEVYRDH